VPWLRRRAINDLRAQHVAAYAFKDGDLAVMAWCSICGAYDHYVFIEKVHRGAARTYADVRLVCKKGGPRKTMGTLFLQKALQPVPKEVLDMKVKWSRARE